MADVYIYVLKCPESGDVRYVGKTKKISKRLAQHASEGSMGKIRSHKVNWVASLIEKGLRPVIEVDSVCCDETWKMVERERIAHYRALGCRLTNGTDGGDGATDMSDAQKLAISERGKAIYRDHPEKRKAISDRMKLKWEDPVYRALHLEAVQEACRTPEFREKISVLKKEMMSNPEARKRQSEIMTELCKSEEWRLDRHAKAKASRDTDEYRSRMSERSKSHWAREEYREKMSKVAGEWAKDPELKAKRSAAIKEAQSSPEFRKMKSDQMKAVWARRKAAKDAKA